MIVVDASALIEVLLQTPASKPVAERLFDSGEPLAAPHLIDVEVAQVLRRYVQTREMDALRAREALQDLAALRLHRFPHDVLLPRIWELRGSMTAYDAAYVALAEALPATLVTRNAKLAGAAGHRAKVELL